MSAAQAVTKDTFKQVVAESDVPVLVDFWAPWCGPCKKLGPILDDVAAELGERVKIVKVNVDEERELGTAFQIMSIPTMIFFKDGEAVAQVTGVQPKGTIVSKLESLM